MNDMTIMILSIDVHWSIPLIGSVLIERMLSWKHLKSEWFVGFVCFCGDDLMQYSKESYSFCLDILKNISEKMPLHVYYAGLITKKYYIETKSVTHKLFNILFKMN